MTRNAHYIVNYDHLQVVYSKCGFRINKFLVQKVKDVAEYLMCITLKKHGAYTRSNTLIRYVNRGHCRNQVLEEDTVTKRGILITKERNNLIKSNIGAFVS